MPIERGRAGGRLRQAGKQDRTRLLAFLDQHAGTMPRILKRYAIVHLDKELRFVLMSVGKGR